MFATLHGSLSMKRYNFFKFRDRIKNIELNRSR